MLRHSTATRVTYNRKQSYHFSGKVPHLDQTPRPCKTYPNPTPYGSLYPKHKIEAETYLKSFVFTTAR